MNSVRVSTLLYLKFQVKKEQTNLKCIKYLIQSQLKKQTM